MSKRRESTVKLDREGRRKEKGRERKRRGGLVLCMRKERVKEKKEKNKKHWG